MDTCPVPRSPMQTSGLMDSPRSVGSPRFPRTPIQTSGFMDSPRSVGSPRSLRSSIQASGLMDSPHSTGSPWSLQSPRFSPSPSLGKPPQVYFVLGYLLCSQTECFLVILLCFHQVVQCRPGSRHTFLYQIDRDT